MDFLYIVWRNGVIPFAMKIITSQANGCEFIIRNLDAFWVGISIQLCSYL